VSGKKRRRGEEEKGRKGESLRDKRFDG